MTWQHLWKKTGLIWNVIHWNKKKVVIIIIDLNHWVSQPFFCLTHYYHLVFAFQETLISSLVFPHFHTKAINVFLAFVIALICVSELTLVRSLTTSIMFCNQYCRLFGLRMTLKTLVVLGFWRSLSYLFHGIFSVDLFHYSRMNPIDILGKRALKWDLCMVKMLYTGVSFTKTTLLHWIQFLSSIA